MAEGAPPAPNRWCAPSAKPELAPRTAAPPGSPGTTPLDAARSTTGGTGRRCLGRGDAAPELPGTDGQLNSVSSRACAHPPAVVGDCPGWMLGIVARLVVVGLLGKGACATSR